MPTHRLLDYYNLITFRAKFAVLFADIFRKNGETTIKKYGLTRQQQKSALEFIHSTLTKNVTVRGVAHYLKMNTDYFSRQFYKSFNIQPRSYIKREKINLASTLLSESNLNISEISERLGYSSVPFFIRQFKEEMNITPLNYRK